jgi:hypothetical protein
MKQQVDVTLKLSLWLDATWGEDDIVTHVRSALPDAFGESLTGLSNPVDVLSVRQEAELYAAPARLPDLEELNDDRALWAETALAAFVEQTGCNRDDALPDLLCDLMHWCDRTGVPFAEQLTKAEWHYRVEATGEDA